MTKILVETKGDFQLVDFSFNQAVLASHRPSVMESTSFIQHRIANGTVTLHGPVSEEATDVEFEAYWKESGDATLAIESFLASFPVIPETEKVVAEADQEKPKSKAKAKVEAE